MNKHLLRGLICLLAGTTVIACNSPWTPTVAPAPIASAKNSPPATPENLTPVMPTPIVPLAAAATLSVPPKQSIIYLVAANSRYSLQSPHKEIVQIWQVASAGDHHQLIYEFNRIDHWPYGTITLPSREDVDKYAKELDPKYSVADVEAVPTIEQLSLSPDRDQLAWVEEDFYYVGIAQISTLGSSRVMVMDLKTLKPRVVFEIPKGGNGFLYNLIDYGPVWSSDGKHLAIVRSAYRDSNNTLTIVDIEAGKTLEFPGGKYSPVSVTWSPDGSTVAWRTSNSVSENVLQFCNLDMQQGCHEIELKFECKGEGFICNSNWSPVWAPDGKTIALVGDAYHALYLLRPKTGELKKITGTEGIFENPRWSPNARLLAVDHRPTRDDLLDSLMVISPDQQKVVAELSIQRSPEERSPDWTWHADSNKIVVVWGDGLGIFDVDNDQLHRVSLADDLKNKFLAYPVW